MVSIISVILPIYLLNRFFGRYARSVDNPDPEPLWTNASTKPALIPMCERCGSERTFEFQIMPQLLNYLKLNELDPDSLDFGTLIVYTCSKSCKIPAEMAFGQEEYLWRQDFSLDSMGMENKKNHFNGKE
jgi:pre-rRNA-processing protein TSR4